MNDYDNHQSVMYCMHFAAVFCAAVPTWAGMVVNTTSRKYQTVTNASCAEGFVFDEAHEIIIATCSRHGTWEPYIWDCVGEYYSCY